VTVVVLLSARGAPGVTTLACALGAVWPRGRDVVIAECDPAGGDLAARFSLSPDVGMSTLAMALRHSDRETCLSLDRHVQRLPGGLEILCGPVGADAGHVLDTAVATLDWDSLGIDSIVDCGRLGAQLAGQQGAIRSAHRVVLLARPDASSIAQCRWALSRLAALRPSQLGAISLLIAGPGVFDPVDIAETLGVELLGVIPHDPEAAAVLRGEPGANRAFARSALVTSASALAAALTEAPADAPADFTANMPIGVAP